jgi:uridine kinase
VLLIVGGYAANSYMFLCSLANALSSSRTMSHDQGSMPRSILDAIQQLRHDRGDPVLIAVDGPSGCGKSTLAAALAAALDAVVVPGDDFFAAEITAIEWEGRTPAERARDAIDWRRLRREALDPLLAGRPTEWHPFDFTAGERPDGTYAMDLHPVRREPAAVIILDGAYSARPELAALVDLSVLVEVPASVRQQRLAAREAPAFLAAWHLRWDAAEAFYFTHVRPADTFDLIVDGMSTNMRIVREPAVRHP